jgi:hypothetical protein
MNNKIKFDELIKKLDREFDLSGLEFVGAMLLAGMETAAYENKIDVVWHHDGSSVFDSNGATFHVRSAGEKSWGSDWVSWEAEGTMEWWTSSDHYVRIRVEQDDDGCTTVSEVVIGNDESDVFYSTVAEVIGFTPKSVDIPERPEV